MNDQKENKNISNYTNFVLEGGGGEKHSIDTKENILSIKSEWVNGIKALQPFDSDCLFILLKRNS